MTKKLEFVETMLNWFSSELLRTRELDAEFLASAYDNIAPHWISVEDELPKIGWTMSDTVVVTDGNGGLRLAWYHQDEGWHFATGLTFEPTHWMPLPQPPVVSISSNTGKNC